MNFRVFLTIWLFYVIIEHVNLIQKYFQLNTNANLAASSYLQHKKLTFYLLDALIIVIE